MTTLGDWVEDVRGHLDAPKRDSLNVLAAPHTAGGNLLTFAYPLKAIGEGALLSIGTASFYVLDSDETAKTATVIPGFQGSDDIDLTSGTVVRVNPGFTDHRIARALNAHLSTLSAPSVGLYQTKTLDITYTAPVQGYELPDLDLLGVLEVRRQTSGPAQDWPRLAADEWELIRDAETSVFPSGQAIRLRCGTNGFLVRVTYAANFADITGAATDVATSGIPDTADDIPPIGAAIRLMAGREVSRNSPSSQGDSRRATEVPQGAVLNSYQGLAQMWRQRVLEESSRLRAVHGPVM